MRARKLFFVAAALSALIVSVSAQARPPLRIAGVVPHRGAGVNGNEQNSGPAGIGATNAQNLTYHGGEIMQTNKTYTIFWVPSGYSVAANYQSLINGFLQNVAADSGKFSNVYATDPQYYQTVGGTQKNVQYSSTYGGTTVATDALPSVVNQCTMDAPPANVNACVTDQQLQDEIAKVVKAKGWPTGNSTEYFMLTASGIGSCVDTFEDICSDNYYCAYHSSFYPQSLNYQEVIYANQPYSADYGYGCDPGQSPNGNAADATLNVLSHEHNESITDPDGGGWWYDDPTNGEVENGDACAWNFGSALGSTTSGQYNQVIGTGKYWLQQEWSNAQGGCRLTMPAPASAPTISSFAPTSGPVGSQVTLTGANFTGATAVSLRGVNTTFTVNSPTSITAKVPNISPDGLWRVTTPGGTAVSAARYTIAQPPTLTSFSPSSGTVGTQVTLTGTRFTGATAVSLGSAAASFTVVSATSIKATVPSGAASGKWKVTTPGGTATSAASFTVKAPAVGAPTITSFSPLQAPVGASVTITGTNFVNVKSVTLHYVNATYTVNSATSITVTVPSTGYVTGLWRVTTASGTATGVGHFTTG